MAIEHLMLQIFKDIFFHRNKKRNQKKVKLTSTPYDDRILQNKKLMIEYINQVYAYIIQIYNSTITVNKDLFNERDYLRLELVKLDADGGKYTAERYMNKLSNRSVRAYYNKVFKLTMEMVKMYNKYNLDKDMRDAISNESGKLCKYLEVASMSGKNTGP